MTNHWPKTLLLDLDDTILELSNSRDRCWQSSCTRFISQLDGLTPEVVFTTIKEKSNWFWKDVERQREGRLNMQRTQREIVAAALRQLGRDNRALAHEIADVYMTEREETLQLFPGAIDTLHRLREQSVRLALITNGSTVLQRRKIEKFALASFFDCILIEGEFGMGKPDRRVYLHVLDQLGATPAETWMVGDNLECDVAAPQQLGIFGIWVDVAGIGLAESSPVRPDRIIRLLSELI